MSADPSTKTIPFGKYKGLTVAELLARDSAYAQWLLGQGWLAERFAELHAAILTRGAASDETPEHNRLQARFLCPVFCLSFMRRATGAEFMAADHISEFANRVQCWRSNCIDRWKRIVETAQRSLAGRQADVDAMQVATRAHLKAAESALKRAGEPILAKHISFQADVRFEQKGIDVVLRGRWSWPGDIDDYRAAPTITHSQYTDVPPSGHIGTYGIELKPSLGDDFPSVMRQMQRLKCSHLVIQQYAGRGAPLETVRKMFANNEIDLITVQEIEAEVAYARAVSIDAEGEKA